MTIMRIVRQTFTRITGHWKVWLGALAALLLVVVAADFFTSSRVLSTSETTISPRQGEVRLTYRHRAPRQSWVLPEGFHASFEYPEETIEVIRVSSPTRFNKSFALTRKEDAETYRLFGLFRPRAALEIQTIIDKVTVETMAPAVGSQPAPETMNNQIMVRFSSPIHGAYPLKENIPPSDMHFAKLTPVVRGYYRFSDARTLTFSFTEDRPQFETTYTVEVAPGKFIDPADQIWTDTSTTFSFKTASNIVYVSEFSISDEAKWSDTLTISFSGAMVDAFKVLKENGQDGFPVQISPKTEGVWVWTNSRTLDFRPNLEKGGWPIRETIKVTVDPKINTEDERTWRRGKNGDLFSFYVPPIPQRIQSLSPDHDHAELDAPIVARFSRKMVDKDMIRRPFEASSAPHVPLLVEPAVAGKFLWTRPDTLKFTPSATWKELTEFHVRLNPKYRPDKRYEWEGKREFKFKTVENILQYSAYLVPEDGLKPSEFYDAKSTYAATSNIPTQSRLWIEFDRPAGSHWSKAKGLERSIRFDPAVEGRFRWLGPTLLEFVPDNDWPELSDIKVTATPDLFWHSEQHFPKGKESVAFKTAKNAVTVRRDGSGEHLPDRAIVLKFSRKMKTGLTVGKTYPTKDVRKDLMPVSISPAIQGDITWVNARTLKIQSANYLEPKTTYAIEVRPTILPRTQSKFAGASRLAVTTTTNDLRIKRFTPAGVVRGRAVFDVEFTKRVKPPGVKVGDRDTSGLFTTRPEIRGHWIWMADNKIQLKPARELQRATGYEVTFHPDQVSDRGLTWFVPKAERDNPKPVTYNLRTAPLRVQRAVPRQVVKEDDPLKQRLYIDFELSEPVSEADLKAKFSFWYERPETGGNVEVPITYQLDLSKRAEGQTGYDRVSVVSDWLQRPAQNHRIYYRIAKGLKPIVGSLALQTDYQSNFLQEKPRKIAIKTLRWTLKDRVHSASLTLNAPVTPEKLERALVIRSKKVKIKGVSVTIANTRAGSYAYTIAARFKPGSEYAFVLPEALLATDGAFAAKEVKATSTVPHLPTELDFALPGHILARKQLHKVPVVTTNRKKFRLYIHRIYPNNVRQFLNHSMGRNISGIAKQIYSGDVETESDTDVPTTTHVNMAELFDANKFGMHRICIGSGSCSKQRWFIATDIGLMSRRFGDNLVVWARSLTDASPLSGVELSVVDAWNQTIATSRTDESGLARITLAPGQVPSLILGRSGDDQSFISMAAHRDRLKGFAIGGVSAEQEALRTFVYSDRGVYRPGETVHLVAVTRGQKGKQPSDYPLELRIQTPRGTTIAKERFRSGGDGVFVHNFDIDPEAKTGHWKVAVHWRGRTIGRYKFQVEEFIPAKLKVSVQSTKPQVYGGEKLAFKVSGHNLFGPPAAGNEVRAKVQLRANFFKPPGFDKYWFGHEDVKFQRIDKQLKAQLLDEDGQATFTYVVPEGIVSPIGLEAHFSAEVLGDGGRAVAAFGQTSVLLHERFVGIKKLTAGRLEVRKPVRFDVVNVFPSGERVPLDKQVLNVRAFIEKEVAHYKKDERGSYKYVSEKELQPVDAKDGARDAQGRFVFVPKHGGRYMLEVEDGVGGQVTRSRFYVRGGRPDPLAAREPDRVQIRLLNKDLKIGGMAQIEVRAPFAGTLMLLGEKDALVYSKTMEVTQRPVVVEVPLDPRHLPNFYLSATVIRGTKDLNADVPICATGLLNIEVEDPRQRPKFEIITPVRVAPNGKFEVSVKVAELDGRNMYFTLAVVDEGILSLTGFETPDMDQYFNQKQRLEVLHYRMYDMVVPYLPDGNSEVSPSGDAPSRALIKRRRVNPKAQKRQRSVALWSGLQKTDDDGFARVSFTMPDFNGSVRVMAVAFGDQRFASAQKSVVVRDDLVLKPSVPRFGAAGDEFTLPFKVFNGTDLTGDVVVHAKISSHLSLVGPARRTVSLAPGKTATGSFLLKTNRWKGVAAIDLTAEGLKETTRKHYDLPLRAPGHMQVRSGGGVVDKNAPVTVDIPRDFVPESEELALRVSSDPMLRFKNSLRYLVRYPHGCLEQTTSRAFPLLYYAAMAKDDVGSTQGARTMVKAAIGKIQQMQNENGAFSYWPGSSNYNNWASVYAAHFLVESRGVNYHVNESTWNNMLVFLNRVADDRELGLSEVVYALYVLALAKENVLSKLNYTYDGLWSELKVGDRARLAAAFAVLGQKQRAQEMLAELDAYSVFGAPYRQTGGNLGSHVRDLAITLDAMVQGAGGPEPISALATQLLKQAEGGRWGTTQENAFALLALGKMFKSGQRPQATGTVKLGDSPPVKVETTRLFRTEELTSHSVRIEARGDGELSYTWEAMGLPKKVVSLQKDSGLRVRRAWKDKSGKDVDLSEVLQGDVLVAEIKIRSEGGALQNVVVSDLLPAGFEIENARLKTSTKLEWLAEQPKPDYIDIRDDRINIYTAATARDQTFYYAVRAVTVGKFTVPAIRAEAMYDPNIFSEADHGELRVVGTGR